MHHFVDQLQDKLSNFVPQDEHLSLDQYRIGGQTEMPENQILKSAAVLILLYPVDSIVHFTLIKRSERGVHGGQIALPGGKMDLDDRSLIHTAIRETNEEIGVAEEAIKIVGNLSTVDVTVSGFKVFPFIGFCEFQPEFILQEEEVAAIHQIPIEELVHNSNYKVRKVQTKLGFNLQMPSYKLDDQIVWGATGKILTEFKNVSNEIL